MALIYDNYTPILGRKQSPLNRCELRGTSMTLSWET